MLYFEKLIRKEQSACVFVNPNADSVGLVFPEREEQAEPLDTKMPFADKKCSIVSLFIFGSVIFIIWSA